MRQKAVVLSTKGKTAQIEVSRATMCDGCIKNGDGSEGCSGHCEITGLISSGGKMKAEAINQAGAIPGDVVEVETASDKVLGYAALVFILPIAVCALFYFIASSLFSAQSAGVIGACVGFVLTFAFIAVIDRAKKKKAPDIVIVKITERAGFIQ